MKTYMKLFSLIVFTVFILSVAKSQVNVNQLIQTINYQLENSDLEKIEDAEKIVEEANTMTEELKAEDERLEKYFKKKVKKGEKKSVYAKQYRIDATNKYYDGLSAVHDVLNARLNFAIFEYPEDQSAADRLKSESDDYFNTVKQNLMSFQGLSKKDLTGLGYYALISELETNVQMMIDGIEKQKDAYAIWAIQAEKKQKDLADENAWANAVNLNTIDGYNEYINNFPSGKYVVEAQDKITELEEQARLAEEERLRKAEEERLRKEQEEAERLRREEEERLRREAELAAQQQEVEEVTGLVFSIQIMAVYFKVDSSKLCMIYPGKEKITERYEDGMYKYTVGEFSTFSEANQFRKKLTIPSFIVAFQDGERISTIDARKIEKEKEKAKETEEID
ncbi:MAG: hypothetical protein JXB17_02055 [Bacteroidales bacterium]|nr:hypothetical protein [Bacteroidales bacterium]